MLGGAREIVEVDESAIGKTKYGRGSQKKTTWVFGMVQRKGPAYAEIVTARDKKTLLPIIRRHVKQGTIIISDEWKAYSCLGSKGFDHRTIKHKASYARWVY
jgi:transposase-like protein